MELQEDSNTSAPILSGSALEQPTFQPWKTIEQMHEAFLKIIESKKMPFNFMQVLAESVGIGKTKRRLSDLTLRFDLRSLMILYHYNEDNNIFSKPWTLEDVIKAEGAMRIMEKRFPNLKSPIPQALPRTKFGIFSNENFEKPKPLQRLRKDPSEIVIRESWKSLLGKSIQIIRSKDFLLVKEIIDIPIIDSESLFFPQVLPYVIQKIKMGGSACIQSKHLSDMGTTVTGVDGKKEINPITFPNTESVVERPWTPFGNLPIDTILTQISSKVADIKVGQQFPISRLDLVVALLSIVDSVLAEDVVRLLGQFSLALPLIMPTLNSNIKESYIVTIPMLQSITVKRGTAREEIFENHLFKSPFRLVVSVRLGNNSLGKSTILNHLMDDPYMFSCSQEPGADRGKPYSLPGSVEFTWLTIENCKDVLWDRLKNLFSEEENCNEILLLANLHGNAIDFPDVVQTMKSLACAFLVFQMPEEELSAMESTFKDFQEAIGTTPAIYLMIDSYKQTKMNVPEQFSIDTRNMKFSTLDKVAIQLANCFKNKIAHCSLNLDDLPLGQHLKLSQRIVSVESQDIIDLISSTSCSEIKEKLKLQKQPITDMEYYENIWRNDPTLRSLIQMIVKMLDMPLQQRQIAFAHLDRETSVRSGDDSRQTRLLLCDLKQQRSKLIIGIPPDERNTNKSLLEIDQKIFLVSEQLEKNNLGLEHFFREVGRIYEIAIHNPEDKFSSIVFGLAPKLAELVIEGQVIELLDGDLGRLSGAWLNAVSHEICKLKPDLKIFVISILGLQSSGKSTLLNALFGCKFSVSSGRCTRGLFIRLLFLEPEFKKSTGIDAILLIDTEGLGAPEKMRDPESETRDRQMATYAMSISHLTIINVLGESMKELADILQIVVVTLARLETIEVTPDILLVQHGSEVDRGKFLSAVTEFCKAIKEAIEVTDKQFTALGILNSAILRNLYERVENHEILKLFHSYKKGATANAPPSREYHEDVVDLYQKILRVMKNSCESAVEFHKWHTILNSCWSAVAIQNFALRFKNIQEIHEFIDRGTRIANVNEAVEEAFGYHRSLLKVYIRNQIFNIKGNEITETFVKGVKEKIEKKLQDTLDLCSTMTRSIIASDPLNEFSRESQQCDRCLIATKKISELQKHIQGKSFEEEVSQTINSHISRVRDDTNDQLTESIMEQFQQKHESEDTDKLLHQLILDHSSNGYDYNKSDGKNRSLIIDNILDKLSQNISSGTTSLANLRDKMFKETMEVYTNTPISDPKYMQRLMTGHTLPDLRGIAAFPSDISTKLSGILQRGIGALTKTKLNMKQASRLEHKLNKIPESILRKQSADDFQIGMIAKLQEETKDILNHFIAKSGQLIGPFKWEVHFYAIKIFYNFMEMRYYQEARRSRQVALAEKADVYRKKIDACLSHGFSYNSEGRILAECFLRALRQKAKKGGDLQRKQELLHQPWLANTENVRLCFFETLAAQVQKGEFENTLEYFNNPKKIITSWFENKVDSFNITQAKFTAQDIFNVEMEKLWKEISNANSCNEIKDYSMKYFSEVDGIQYSNELNFSNASLKHFKEFRHSLYKTLKEKCQDHFNAIVYKACSQHKAVMDRLGCTEFCYWCGGLCWGHATHEQNKDNTKKHHTCHQPQGLIGVFDERTGNLLPNTCDSMQDDSVSILAKSGQNKDGMTWKEIKKSKELQNWIFISHSVDDFNNLMGWFFVKLHKEIAARAGLNPCDEKDLKGMGLAHLDSKLDTIMTIIKQKLM